MRPVPFLAALVVLVGHAFAQNLESGSVAVKQGLDRLQQLGSVLMIAAHPDDENTALLGWLALGRHYRTGYLSLTRGEGGQNLIGAEQGEALGLIRTQELLAARRLDGAEQYFTRAIDFGFTKTTEETLRRWGRDRILADVVWNIRRFRPDVIILRFSGTPADGHGQHQTSAILGAEAFAAAADPARFPEQLQYVKPWQAKRLLHNLPTFSPQSERQAAGLAEKITINTGEYDAELGYSFEEIAARSRSMHRSQAMGVGARRGSRLNFLVVRAGTPAKSDLFEGIDTTWARVPGGAPIAEMLASASKSFPMSSPEKLLPTLLNVRKRLGAIDDPWAKRKLLDLDELIGMTAGLWLDATSKQSNVSPGGELEIDLNAINRSSASVQLMGVRFTGVEGAESVSVEPGPLDRNRPVARKVRVPIPANHPFTVPYWLSAPGQPDTYSIPNQQITGLAEGPPLLSAVFRLRTGDQEFELARPVINRYVDPVRGELTRPILAVPPVAVNFAERSVVFPGQDSRQITVQVRATTAPASVDLKPKFPSGWRVEPDHGTVKLESAGQLAAVRFNVTPTADATEGTLEFPGFVGLRAITHEHIPPQTLFPPASLRLVHVQVKLLSKRIGYIMGAGDLVPAALQQMGAQVTVLTGADLAQADLSGFDAIVAGVRAYNTRADLRAAQQRLMDYVNSGGTYIVQYNVAPGGFSNSDSGLLDHIGPYPLHVSHARVTVEDSPVKEVRPDDPLLQFPNKITPADYQGWVQERGLYFADKWDPQYQALWRMSDPGEAAMEGGTLYTRYGKGTYIFTPISWFRQLPAGVPGAYRIFANFLSAGKAPR